MVVDEKHEHDAGVGDPVLVDLLRGMISGSRWCYAELWLPNALARRHMVEVNYARPGTGAGMRALESLSRALALRPTDCLLKRSAGTISASNVSTVDTKTDDLAASPRAAFLREASIASALSFKVVDGQLDQKPLGIVVLMSQSGPAADAQERAAEVLALEQISSLCAAATPYLRHIGRVRSEETAAGVIKPEEKPFASVDLDEASATRASSADVMQADDKQQHTRSPITYRSPVPRRKFNAVPEDIRTKHGFKSSPSGNKLGIKDGASLSVEYQIAITEALSNVPPHDNGKPHVVRVSVLWAIFEQLCEVPSAISSVLKLMRPEFKQAIFSDDLMSADDGLSLMRVPFFEQIDYRVQQVIERDAKVAQLEDQIKQLQLREDEQRSRLDQAEQIMTALKRKAFVAERRLVKLRLMTFFERKNMAKDVRREQNEYFEQLKAEIATLKEQLKSERDKSQHLIVEDYRNVDVLNVVLESMSAAACPLPSVATNLVCNSALDGAVDIYGQMQDMKGELEVFRNANLTQYERGYGSISDADSLVHGDKYAFAPTMELLDEEIAALDSCISRGHGNVAMLAASYVDMLDEVHRELSAALPTDNVLGAAAASKAAAARDTILRVPSRSQDEGMDGDDEQCVDDQSADAPGAIRTNEIDKADQATLWKAGHQTSFFGFGFLDKTSSHADVDLYRMLHSRSCYKRQRARELDLRTVTTWVYDVLQRKSRADVLLQNDLSLPYRSVEETVFDYLDEKYGTRQASNLAAYDLMRFVEEHRRTNKILQLFARSVTGAFDAEWKYVIRVQQYMSALYPEGFANIGIVQNFFIRHLYPDQSREEIDRVVSSLSNFSPYIRHLAEASGRQVPLDVSETAAPEQVAEGGITEVDGIEMRRPLSGVLLAEFVASLLERDDELRLKKALILIQVDGFDEPKPVTYAEFEALSAKCTPHEMEVKDCQSYYRMLLRTYPDSLFPARSLALCMATLELEILLARQNISRDFRLSL